MSIKLKVLERLKEAQIISYDICWDDDDYGDETIYTLEDLISSEDISIIEKALTPPTADEVCNALSECLRLDKYHSKCIFKDNNFYERCNDGVLETIVDNDNGLIDIYFNLPPQLITLIGRFYEGESK